jgi:predicted metal-dependent hydrolase
MNLQRRLFSLEKENVCFVLLSYLKDLRRKVNCLLEKFSADQLKTNVRRFIIVHQQRHTAFQSLYDFKCAEQNNVELSRLLKTKFV